MNRSNSKGNEKGTTDDARSTRRRKAARQRGPRFSIFISHVHEEAKIAEVLRDWLEAAFPGRVRAFVSSDYEDNPLGKRWLEYIDRAMHRSRLLITLLSPRSSQRMWIHLEAGWALGRKIDILPVCHSGMSITDLPRPYSDYSGTEVERDDFARRLLMALKRHLGLDHRSPPGMLQGLTADVRQACAELPPTSDDRAGVRRKTGNRRGDGHDPEMGQHLAGLLMAEPWRLVINPKASGWTKPKTDSVKRQRGNPGRRKTR